MGLLSIVATALALGLNPALVGAQEAQLPPSCDWLPVEAFETRAKVKVTDIYPLFEGATAPDDECVLEFEDRASHAVGSLGIQYLPPSELDYTRATGVDIRELERVGDEGFLLGASTPESMTAFVRRGDAGAEVTFLADNDWTPKRARAATVAAARFVGKHLLNPYTE